MQFRPIQKDLQSNGLSGIPRNLNNNFFAPYEGDPEDSKPVGAKTPDSNGNTGVPVGAIITTPGGTPTGWTPTPPVNPTPVVKTPVTNVSPPVVKTPVTNVSPPVVKTPVTNVNTPVAQTSIAKETETNPNPTPTKQWIKGLENWQTAGLGFLAIGTLTTVIVVVATPSSKKKK